LIHHATIIELEGESYRKQQYVEKTKSEVKRETT
jgi:hypothetical protein